MTQRTTLVDFIARGDVPDEWQMVLVEEGPWQGPIDSELRRVQDRLYGAIDAALEGQLAEQFPDAMGKRIIIQLDCYNCPTPEVSAFFERFSSAVFETADYKQALERSQFVSGIALRLNTESTDTGDSR